MKYSHVAVALICLIWPASPAWAQYGLSGAPEMLTLSATSAGAQQSAYPTTSAPPVVPADPVMRPITSFQATPVAVNAGYYGSPSPLAPAGRASPLAPPVPPPMPNALQPTLPPLGSAGQAPGLTGQMLTDPSCTSGNCWSGYGNGAIPAPGPSCEFTPRLYQPVWYASASGLIMTRNNANRVWTTYHTDHNAEQLMHTQEAMPNWQGGYEVTLGRMFDCNRWGVEVSYWWLGEMNGFAEVANRDYNSEVGGFSYSTPLSFDGVVWANPAVAGTPSDIFDFSRQHRIWRTNSFQNLEINLIRHQISPDCGNGVAIDWSLGARYFQFDEQLRVGALRQNVPPEATNTWGGSNGECEAYLDDSIKNSLIGFQFGLSAVYPIHSTLRLFVSPKFGIYNNHIQNRFAGYRGDGEVFGPSAASGETGSFPVSANTDALAFLTEVNVGLDWNFAPRWTAFLGYRAVWATGIGLADNQYLPYVVDIPGHRHIETNGELVLHGAFAGLTFCF